MKFKNYEDAKNQADLAKNKSETLVADLKAVRGEFKIAKDTDPATVSGKAGKAYSKALKAYKDNKAVITEAKEFMTNNKPKKEKKERAFKYDYPKVDGKEMTSEQKKKYRAEQRAAAKRALKEKNGGGSKKAKKEEPKADKKADKKSGKSKDKKPGKNKDSKKEAAPKAEPTEDKKED